MQNIISNWTKINQDHVEYFEKDEASAAGGGGGSVHSNRSNLSHALHAAGIDPRSPEMGASGMGPSPPPPSGSSLSNVSFSNEGAITAPSRRSTPDTASSTSFVSRPRSVVISSHNGFMPQHQDLYQQQQQQQQQQQVPQMLMMMQQQNGRRRSNQPNHVHGGHYGNYQNHINPLPPPQAGADAILGRRKPTGIGQVSSQHYNFDMASAMGVQQIHQGEPPPSLSTSSEQQDAKRAASAAAGGLQRTQSSSLWHSQKSIASNQSNHSSRSSSNSVTASLDKMDAAAQAAMAELNSVNSRLNEGLANFSKSNRSAQYQPTRSNVINPITNISSNSSTATNNSSRNILKFNRQKLRKSHSRSDLVREMALDRRHNDVSDQIHPDTNPSQRRVSEKSSTSGSNTTTTPISSMNLSIDKPAHFPASLETANKTSARSALRNGRVAEAPSFNSHTMMHDLNQSLAMRRQSSASAGVSSGSTPIISNPNLTSDRRMSNVSQGMSLDAINEQKAVDIGVVNISSSQLQHQQQQQQQQIDSNPGCDRCVQMESAILSLQADIEYVRTLELQKEFVCRECESGPPPPAQSVSSAVSLGSKGSRSSRLPRRKNAAGDKSSIGSRFSRTVLLLRDASKRLADLSTRHKKEVKQSHYERAYWQNDMHLKLEKFAMMCKNLNEDAAQRSNEVKELTSKLEMVTAERNGLVSQVETLKARVGLYEGESVVQSRLRENFQQGEAGGLDLFEKAMKGRDEAIEDLSKRLTFALQEVENNRLTNTSMRRQIIFPPSRTMSSQSESSRDAVRAPPSPKLRRSICSEGEEGFENNESTQLSEKALLSLEIAMVQSSDREKAMQSQLDALEQELEDARAILRTTDDHYLEAQLSIKHITSNSSL